MNNQTFLQSIGVADKAKQRKCLKAMEKYGDNHWWEPDVDPRKFAYYQINEALMLCSNFSRFHESIELLLGRPVFTHEFALNADGLKQEAERAWTYQVGCTSDAERQDKVIASMDMLDKWAKEHGKQVIQVNLPENDDRISP
jgi:hypothetical protein